VTDDLGTVLSWKLGKTKESHSGIGFLGSLGVPLIITLNSNLTKGEIKKTRIYYRTNPSSLGIKWVAPEMTYGKKYAFVYTQGESIHARSFIPCQDTPASKLSVTSYLTVAKPLVAVFPGNIIKTFDPDVGTTTYGFEQKKLISTYLLAISAGALEFKQINERSGVWAEKEIINKSEKVFNQTETFIKTVS